MKCMKGLQQHKVKHNATESMKLLNISHSCTGNKSFAIDKGNKKMSKNILLRLDSI